MANLAIKTPSSASLVLIFQLLVLRPRPSVYVCLECYSCLLTLFSLSISQNLRRFTCLSASHAQNQSTPGVGDQWPQTSLYQVFKDYFRKILLPLKLVMSLRLVELRGLWALDIITSSCFIRIFDRVCWRGMLRHPTSCWTTRCILDRDSRRKTPWRQVRSPLISVAILGVLPF